MSTIETPYCLFLADATDHKAIKTASGLVEWAPERVACEFALPGCTVTSGASRAETLKDAVEKFGARTLVVGVVTNTGDTIPASWRRTFADALATGLDVASGMHDMITDDPKLSHMAMHQGRKLHDFRFTPKEYKIGKGQPRSGLRIMVIGQDCNIGKKYTSVALTRMLVDEGVNATFRATGQTGALIADGQRSVVVDTVVSDFLTGAVEWLCPAASPDHVDVVEGQGCLWSPGSGQLAVSLLYGSQPDFVVMCVDPDRRHLRGLEYQVVDLEFDIKTNLQFARRVNPHSQLLGISVNLSGVAADDVPAYMSMYDKVARRFSGKIGSKDFIPAAFDPNSVGSCAQVLQAVKTLVEENVAGRHRNIADKSFMDTPVIF